MYNRKNQIENINFEKRSKICIIPPQSILSYLLDAHEQFVKYPFVSYAKQIIFYLCANAIDNSPGITKFGD